MAEFLEGDADRALHWLSQSSVGDDFRRLLERHGHRCVKEAEMRNRSWKEIRLCWFNFANLCEGKNTPGRNGKRAVAGGNCHRSLSDRETKRGVTLEEMIRTRWSHVLIPLCSAPFAACRIVDKERCNAKRARKISTSQGARHCEASIQNYC